ncbi:low-density lipoprotein receptor [Brachyhypopomus gauderio]|uniref:low-density lipoprotein receptor n=1 Tax=Brachyhypopomus gauderio TaxID=698409 RepID=UPI004041078C
MDRLVAVLLLTTLSQLKFTAGVRRCSSEQFTCGNGRCVSASLRCDGVDQCGDGSDELSCHSCTTGAFHCVAASRCVPASALCNGHPDCPNGEDEQLGTCAPPAGPRPKPCISSEFGCSNGQCVPHSWRCDGSSDCEDSSDEDNCDQNECEINNGGCSHVCVDFPSGFVCDCPAGMHLVTDTHCKEVDPCWDADVCDQVCERANGSFTCDCYDGYVKDSEMGVCLATGDVARVVFSTAEGIGWMDTQSSLWKKITNLTGVPGPITAHVANSTLYWSNPEHAYIYRWSLDEPEKRPVVHFRGTEGILGLALDWIHELLYWTSNSTGGLHVTALNGSEHRVLVSALAQPTAVAVHPLLGILFWADGGTSPRIERAGLDGQNRRTLVTSVLLMPVSITLDIPRGLLYWADSGFREISRITFDGQHRKTVVESNGYLDQPFGLAVFESRVYWTDRLTGSVCSADKHGGRQLRVTQSPETTSPAGLLIYHQLLQDTGTAMSPSEAPPEAADSAFTWILCLIVLLVLLVVSLLFCGWYSFSSPVHHDDAVLSSSESRDPLVLPEHTDTHPDKV